MSIDQSGPVYEGTCTFTRTMMGTTVERADPHVLVSRQLAEHEWVNHEGAVWHLGSGVAYRLHSYSGDRGGTWKADRTDHECQCGSDEQGNP